MLCGVTRSQTEHPGVFFNLALFVFHQLISVAGLCDINEGSATSEDRCKSPTSGNMSFNVLLQKNNNNKNVGEI